MTRRGRKPRMPEVLRPLADAALARVRKMGAVPMVWEMPEDVKSGAQGSRCSGWFLCPYDKQDEDRWYGLIMEIFGTRNEAVAHMFMVQLAALCDKNWQAPGGWHTDEVQMTQLLTIIHDLKPRNTAEAGLAAQLCALHLSAMKLGSAIAQTWSPDPRTVAIMAKTARAYSDGLITMERLKGRANKSRQTIKVEKHTHTHQHIHLEGEAKFGGQAHAKAARAVAELRSLSGPSTGGEVLPGPGRQRQARLPHARGRNGDRGAQG